MGVRLYNPATGRFLSLDPVYGGNANAYDYVHADPLNSYDLDGKWGWFKKKWKRFKRSGVGRWVKRNRVWIAGGLTGVGCGLVTFGTAAAACAVIAGGAASAGAQWAGNRRSTRSEIMWAGISGAAGFGGGGAALGAIGRWGLKAGLRRWLPGSGRHATYKPASHRKRNWYSRRWW